MHGHIIGKTLRGRGDATKNGQCVNMVPQSSTPNGQMGNQAEKYVKGIVEGSETVPFFYIVVPIYEGRNYMPTSMHPFVISPVLVEAIGPFVNFPHHVTQVGAAP